VFHYITTCPLSRYSGERYAVMLWAQRRRIDKVGFDNDTTRLARLLDYARIIAGFEDGVVSLCKSTLQIVWQSNYQQSYRE